MNKRKDGRLFKKNTNFFDQLSVDNFSFDEIVKQKFIQADNFEQNIVHARLHEKSEVDSQVQNLDLEHANFSDNKKVIKPLNFTQDWKESKEVSTKSQEFDDEDEYELYIERLEREHRERNKTNKDQQEERDVELLEEPTANVEDKKKQSSIELDESDPVSESKSESVSESKSESASESKIESASESKTESASESKIESAAESKTESASESKSEPADFTKDRSKNNMADEKKEDDFEGSSKEAINSMLVGDDKKVNKDQEMTKDLDSLEEERKKVLSDLQKSGELVSGLKSLKKDVLNNIQDNFNQIIKGLANAIFEKEVKLNPELLVKLIQRVVKNSVQDDIVSILVNPEEYKVLNTIDIGDLGESLEPDSTIKKGEFKIKSEMGTVTADLQSLISDILNEINLNLFDSK